ncbi:DUF1127 domain-containing protein [Pseudohalocynthiibacter aestuariivivens]|uniref:DUF1127 domain-containing protein n=1 Tax=Roseovarius pelagicus TaxID=2980108 RepID=A0ABY6DF13_9RHOB|nr:MULTISPECIES: DUF1127 domain-containing protein [Rhodobacterales]QIE46736.1 DUF1127 domain-containing protein [Pseudohalocynthiibacter aestuariivivens]UXX84726.1 DUF1127 domain-containing protein [Roseovarius pelagicus]
MSAIDTTRTAHTSANPFAGTVARLIANVAAWNDARATRKALAALSDRALEDIGLSRAEIDTFGARR